MERKKKKWHASLTYLGPNLSSIFAGHTRLFLSLLPVIAPISFQPETHRPWILRDVGLASPLLISRVSLTKSAMALDLTSAGENNRKIGPLQQNARTTLQQRGRGDQMLVFVPLTFPIGC